MSHPQPASRRAQLGAALKRNLARRKAVANMHVERGQEAQSVASQRACAPLEGQQAEQGATQRA